MKIHRLRLERVEYMPKELSPGILYVAEHYGAAAHLCACGCGRKIRTPLGPEKWSMIEDEDGPSLWPSVGNWQQDCKSHYIIRNGDIVECFRWTDDEILSGRRNEERRAREHFQKKYGKKRGLKRFVKWLMRFWK